jgi:hypothetical protein
MFADRVWPKTTPTPTFATFGKDDVGVYQSG